MMCVRLPGLPLLAGIRKVTARHSSCSSRHGGGATRGTDFQNLLHPMLSESPHRSLT